MTNSAEIQLHKYELNYKKYLEVKIFMDCSKLLQKVNFYETIFIFNMQNFKFNCPSKKWAALTKIIHVLVFNTSNNDEEFYIIA